MIENSISDGALYPYRFSRKGGADTDDALLAQGLLDGREPGLPKRGASARRSRLTHGLGIVSLGYLMDAIADYFGGMQPDVVDFVEHLELVAPGCAWTGGYWQLGPYRANWNDFRTRRAMSGHRRPPADRLSASASLVETVAPREAAAGGNTCLASDSAVQGAVREAS